MAAIDDLEALLSDLQHTTEVLRRANLGDRYSTSREDLEPIYQDQTLRSDRISNGNANIRAVTAPSPAQVHYGLDDVEEMVNSYSVQRDQRRKSFQHDSDGDRAVVHPAAISSTYSRGSTTSIGRAETVYRPTAHALLSELNIDDSDKPHNRASVEPSRGSYGGSVDHPRGSYGSSVAADREPYRGVYIQQQQEELEDKEPDYQEQNINGSRRSLGGPSQAQSYADLRSQRSQSRDHLRDADSMIGTMQSDVSSRHGISTIPKGDCAHCGKPIVGQVVIAMGKMWHPEHYVCCECGSELGQRNFFERNGKAYCEQDYHHQFSPRCAGCNTAIKDRCVTALGKNFHLQCFTCCECQREFGDEGFHEKNGNVYCRKDFFRMFAPKCSGCQQAITSNFVTALGTHWHPDCFVCQMCGMGFDGSSFFDLNGQPLCEQHYHERRGSLCAICRHPIGGRCVTAMGAKFHPEHFRCTYCNRQLTKGTFKEVNSKPFCHKCYNNTFALTAN